MFSPNVVAVISVFHAPTALRERVTALLGQVQHVVLVDDGSHSLDLRDVPSERVHQIVLNENMGIAHALNVGVEHARRLSATHVLTLDQDSDVQADHVSELLLALEARGRDGLPIAAAVPGRVGDAKIIATSDGEPFDPIQSGQLLPLATLDLVGGFNEMLFIDAVDSDFTARARRLGFQFMSVDSVSMKHALGETIPLMLFGRHLKFAGKYRNVLYHSPWRTYYMIRNSKYLSLEYSRDARKWVRTRNRRMLEMVAGCLLLGPHRRAQLAAIHAATRDARLGEYGRIPDRVSERLRRLG
ncbi:Glycosyl transferase family 2 [Microbacterium laevaniformans]|uniref:Glycosyl transferase family 2 n=1 Tax=Microbacterium laevaniformans TaxID=36807 RepID=A0A150HCQ8_9MICO|nr:glycosyltransferase [Microbacterium laevaniformans]KXZ59927.1 Glycosyl transferase family 2 [Microbacterium laevaniformans]